MLTARARKALKGCSSNLHKRHRINFFGQIFPIFIRHKFLPKYTHAHTFSPSTISFYFLLGFILLILFSGMRHSSWRWNQEIVFGTSVLLVRVSGGLMNVSHRPRWKAPAYLELKTSIWTPFRPACYIHSHTLSLTHSLTHTLSHTHSHTFSPSLSHTLTPPSQSKEIYARSPGKRASITWLADGS